MPRRNRNARYRRPKRDTIRTQRQQRKSTSEGAFIAALEYELQGHRDQETPGMYDGDHYGNLCPDHPVNDETPE